ncbi:MAG: hypothetical protein EP330_07705 [Deltaproteobacteria bacterium]|nr:MAG: hypothetical protein EP330_07705 [Deltaproteobacteria bacterium]
MRQIAEAVHVAEAPQRFYGLEVGARMTVLQLAGGLLVHSPIGVDPTSVAHLGELRWVLAPNRLHHLYAGAWIDAGAEGCCCPTLPEKRPDLRFDTVIDATGEPFGDEVLAVPLRCFPFTSEVLILHRPSRTLVVTDLVFHFGADAPWLTRAAMWCACGYPGCRTTTLERVGMHRKLAREELGALLELDFDRLVMSHGHVIDQGGKQALKQAFAWLG